MNKRCVFLTTSDLEDFHVYDNLLVEPLANYGWQVDEVSWRETEVNWDQYDVVVIRSTWDYQNAPEAFMQCLEEIEASNAHLENSVDLVKWNIDKGYLKELQQKQVRIVPTVWKNVVDLEQVQASYAYFGVTEIILKPLISANADFTYRLDYRSLIALKNELEVVFSNRPFMIQPFLNSIVNEGEYSLFYFCGHYSHCILKRPASGDFRVQEEHGGRLSSVNPDAEMQKCADQALAALPESPLYARIDLIRTEAGLAVMEVELIEPSLYFNMDEKSPQRFADAFQQRFGDIHT
jgi:glutathione synthase/RimK-type ligase-like ATP-grasp enzyme